MSESSPIVVTFTGFKPGTHARAIYEYLKSSAGVPRSFEEVLNATSDIGDTRTQDSKQNAKGHLTFWTKRQVYVETPAGWVVNPRGVRFVPREFAD